VLGHTGYWGQKLAKILAETHQIVGVDTTNAGELDYVLEGVQAAVVATPPETHYRLVMKCLKAGLDTLVEKPMAMRHSQAKEMADYAQREALVLSVDSTFLHTRAFEYLKALGSPLLSYQSIRLAPPMPQAQITAGWDLIVHDLSIIQGLSSLDFTGIGIEDGSLAQCAFELPSGGSAFIFASRDWPTKERSITLHYPGATYLWTLAGLEKVGKGQVALEGLEPLRRMLGDFITRCENRQITGVTDGLHGAQVVGCLERLFPNHTALRLGGRAMGNGVRGGSAVQSLSV
jgi:hypothetical protein